MAMDVNQVEIGGCVEKMGTLLITVQNCVELHEVERNTIERLKASCFPTVTQTF